MPIFGDAVHGLSNIINRRLSRCNVTRVLRKLRKDIYLGLTFREQVPCRISTVDWGHGDSSVGNAVDIDIHD